ncbi:MAG: PatB family C-S lyase [Puniceicoccales bacterium]|jgi:cystathionine beta-lyase|nr:PatB family C-S lyase [Puniceicoccales bacterium]
MANGMDFNFDVCPERSGTDSTKWARYAGRDVLPAWVADMDFASTPVIVDALKQRLEHHVFGYATAHQSTHEAVIAYLARERQWQVEPEWIVFTPALVPCLHGVIRAETPAGGAVITTTPVYPPFLSAPVLSGRTAECVPMVFDAGRWTFDFDALDAAAKRSQAKVFLLCNPHNPLGRVFTREELEKIAEFSARHGLVVCSDEIHCDLVLDPDAHHISYATLGKEVAHNSVSLFAASKTYNTAGLLCGYAVIPDKALRARFRRALAGVANEVNIFGLVALEAAYRHGAPWQRACVEYLRGNLDLVLTEIARTPGVTIAQCPQATYLAWLDARALGVENPAAVFEAGGVGLNNGADFGTPGFVRLNFGCPRERLREILRRIRATAEATKR